MSTGPSSSARTGINRPIATRLRDQLNVLLVSVSVSMEGCGESLDCGGAPGCDLRVRPGRVSDSPDFLTESEYPIPGATRRCV